MDYNICLFIMIQSKNKIYFYIRDKSSGGNADIFRQIKLIIKKYKNIFISDKLRIDCQKISLRFISAYFSLIKKSRSNAKNARTALFLILDLFNGYFFIKKTSMPLNKFITSIPRPPSYNTLFLRQSNGLKR